MQESVNLLTKSCEGRILRVGFEAHALQLSDVDNACCTCSVFPLLSVQPDPRKEKLLSSVLAFGFDLSLSLGRGEVQWFVFLEGYCGFGGARLVRRDLSPWREELCSLKALLGTADPGSGA